MPLRIPNLTTSSNFDIADLQNDISLLDTGKQNKMVVKVEDYYTTGMDWADAIQNAINGSSSGDIILLPKGQIDIGHAISLVPGRTIMGYGQNTVLKLKNGVNPTEILSLSGLADSGGNIQYQYSLILRDFCVDGNKANNTSGHGIVLRNLYGTWMKDIKVINCKQTGLYFIKCSTHHVINCWSYANDGYNLYTDGNTADFHIHGGDFGSSYYENIYINGPSSSIRNATVWGSRTKSGIFINTNAPCVQIIGCQVEGNAQHGIYTQADHTLISACKIYDNANLPANYGNFDGVYADRTASPVLDLVVTACQIFAGLYASTGYHRYAVNLGNHSNATIMGNSLKYSNGNNVVDTTRKFINGLIAGDLSDYRRTNTFVRGYLTASSTAMASGWVRVPFDGIASDNDSEWDSTNKQVVIKEDGIYQISCSLLYNTANPNGASYLEANIGGQAFRLGGQKYGSLAGFSTVSGSITFKCSAGAIIYFNAYNSAADQILGSVAGYSWFTVARVQ